MLNVQTSISGDVLTIVCKLDANHARPSASGKTRIIASTEGNAKIGGSSLDGLTLGLNLYVPNR